VFGLRYTNPMVPLIAVSQNGDPRGVWTRYRITSSQFLDIDFSRLALTRDTIVAVTYAFDGPSFVTSIKKSELYALPATLPVKIYTGPFNAVPVSGDESSIEYLLTDDGGTRIGIHRLDQLGTSPKLVQGAYPWGRAETRAPQLGTSLRRIDTGFLDIEAAVIRAGVLYTVNATALSSPTRTSILWWKIDPENGKYLGGGMIDDPTGNKYYAYPSIAVNRAGGIMIGFSTFTPAQYPSAGYVYIDPLGAISNEGVLKAGESVTTSNRWGDYSTTVVNPLDDATFWTIQEAAAENHWVAWWGKITIKAKARSARH